MIELLFDFKNLTLYKLQQNLTIIKSDIDHTLNKIIYCEYERTYANTVKPLIDIHSKLQPLLNSYSYVINLYPQKYMRDAASDLACELDKFLIDCKNNKKLADAFHYYEETNYENEKSLLTSEEIRYFENYVREFHRDGIELDDKTLDELIELEKELAELEEKYNKNLNEDNTIFDFTMKELDGIPNSWFGAEKEIISRINNKRVKLNNDLKKFKFTLEYQDYHSGIKYIKNEQVRKKIFIGFENKCRKKNVPIFEKAIKIRNQIAKILGYNNYADYVTEIRIIKNSKNAIDFLHKLNDMFTPIYIKEMNELTTFAKSYKNNPLKKDKLDPWDLSYYSRIYKEKIYGIDFDELRKYFPLESVKQGLFKIFQTLLGLLFEKIETDNKWHNDVELYCVKDIESKELLGYFYLDLFSREGKYPHAAAFNFINGYQIEDNRVPNIITIVCNFSKNKCLHFDNLVTLFHEFGHVMHHICSKPQLSFFNGLNVETDFVEAPSQMLEYWCYNHESLKIMSSHIETTKPISDEIISKIKQFKKIFSGYNNKEQIVYGLFDLLIYKFELKESNEFDSQKLWHDIEDLVMGPYINNKVRLNKIGNFSHLMSDYSAGYYSYQRSETYAANMFYAIFKDGNELNEKIGMKYRKKLLQQGATKDGIDILKEFLGNEPNDNYFLIDNGIKIG